MLLKELGEEATYYYHPDHLGSVSVVSNHRGEPYERVEYLPFGEIWIEETDPATGYIPFRFTAKELDEETGLYYYGARYYEPATSRWMSPDPAGFGLINPMGSDGELRANYSVIEALNWYSYVSNNPVKYVDPTGAELMKPVVVRQSDSRWRESFLGGTKSYDDSDQTIRNTVGEWGCKFVAGVSVGLALADDSNYGRWGKASDMLEAVNKEGNFSFDENSKGGIDVNLSEAGIEKIIESLYGNDVSIDRTWGKDDAVKKLANIDTSDTESYVIGEFKMGEESHFLPLQGLKKDSDGNVTGFEYTESYEEFRQGKFSSTKDLKSIIIITERDQ